MIQTQDHSFLFRMISAAMTPGIHPKTVNINTIRIEPHPLSYTAKGGNRMDNKTLQMLIIFYLVFLRYQWLLRQSRYQDQTQSLLHWNISSHNLALE